MHWKNMFDIWRPAHLLHTNVSMCTYLCNMKTIPENNEKQMARTKKRKIHWLQWNTPTDTICSDTSMMSPTRRDCHFPGRSIGIINVFKILSYQLFVFTVLTSQIHKPDLFIYVDKCMTFKKKKSQTNIREISFDIVCCIFGFSGTGNREKEWKTNKSYN